MAALSQQPDPFAKVCSLYLFLDAGEKKSPTNQAAFKVDSSFSEKPASLDKVGMTFDLLEPGNTQNSERPLLSRRGARRQAIHIDAAVNDMNLFSGPGTALAKHNFLIVGRDRDRSEERRVGKECRSRWSPYH